MRGLFRRRQQKGSAFFRAARRYELPPSTASSIPLDHKPLGEPVIEYPADETNPDEVTL
jgi:hypothetical protein